MYGAISDGARGERPARRRGGGSVTGRRAAAVLGFGAALAVSSYTAIRALDRTTVAVASASGAAAPIDAAAVRASLAAETDLADCVNTAVGAVVGQSVTAKCSTSIWPLPKTYSAGSTRRVVNSEFLFELHGAAADSDIMKAAAARYATLLFPHGGTDTDASTDALSKVHIYIESASGELQLDTKESYTLLVPATGDEGVRISAPTVFGAMHGLETLSQLISYDPDGDAYVVAHSPAVIEDAPRFRYRALMVDAARHFLPRALLERTLDAMAAAKLNVLHLHISDEESFPVQSKSFPTLWQTAFSTTERYTANELRLLVEYARERGVAILPEFDSPGHSKGLCAGAPEGVCMYNCTLNSNWPLRPVERTFEFLTRLWADFADIFPYEFTHTGGDEVETDCWDDDATSKAWMKKEGLNSTDTYIYFVNRNINISKSLGRRPIIWDDSWKDYGTVIDKGSTIMFWTSNSVNGERSMQKAADDGYDVIAASADPWYLSNSNEYNVRDMYEYDPCDCNNAVNSQNCVNTSSACARVLGLEAAYWTDSFDASQLENGLWPRGAALAERGWSDSGLVWYTNSSQAVQTTATRIGAFRCHLMNRGVAAMPVTVRWNHKHGSNRVSEPGSCMVQ